MRLIDYMPPIFSAKLFMEPHGKGRPRARNGGKVPHIYTPQKTKDWQAEAEAWFRKAWRKYANHWPGVAGACPTLPLEGPLLLEVTAAKTRPKRLVKFHPCREIWRTVKPDADNVVKIIADAAQKAGMVKDDKEFSVMNGVSVFAPVGHHPYVRVSIFRAPGVGP